MEFLTLNVKVSQRQRIRRIVGQDRRIVCFKVQSVYHIRSHGLKLTNNFLDRAVEVFAINIPLGLPDIVPFNGSLEGLSL